MAGTGYPVRRFEAFFGDIDPVPSAPDANPWQERSPVVDWERPADFDAALAQRLGDAADSSIESTS